jgi:DNA-binding response OmpR family regulator
MDVRPKILLVEDEPLVASMLTSFLHESGFAVTGVYSAADAATVIINQGSAFDALVTDINLGSGVDGVDLAQLLAGQNPQARVIFVTGHLTAEMRARAPAGAVFLEKPFSPSQLHQALRGVELGTA